MPRSAMLGLARAVSLSNDKHSRGICQSSLRSRHVVRGQPLGKSSAVLQETVSKCSG